MMNRKYLSFDKRDTIVNAMKMMSDMHKTCCCVLDKGRFFGFVNDSDIRRAIVRGVSIEESLETIANRSPITATVNTPMEKLQSIFEDSRKNFIPIVTEDGRLHDLIDCQALFLQSFSRANKVFMMVGGEGKRLRPMTLNTAKPMVSICGTPLLEISVRNLIETGFRNFIFCVNYQAEQIKNYFGNGTKWGAHIEYIHEPSKLGTAGALALYGQELDLPILVLNGDILTGVRFNNLLDFHEEEECQATLGVSSYRFEVPYGVIEISNNRVKKIIEKPSYNFFVNAGIYVLNPEALKLIPKGKPFDMTDLLSELNKHYPDSTICYPIHEYWQDIGTVDDYRRAVKDYNNNV